MNRTAVYKGKNLSYQVTGTGPVVVLIHGFGEDGNIWDTQVSFLQSSFTVIVPHLPGSGSSEIIDNMNMEGLAESVLAILQQENISNCSMIGHSMGGYVTLAFAEKYYSLLNSFGLFHSTALADTEEKKINRRKVIATVEKNGPVAFLKDFVPGLYSSSFKKDHSSVIEDHIKKVSYFSNEALIAYSISMLQRPDRTNVLKQNKMPVLFVLGREDNVVRLQDGLKLVSMPDISYIHILEQSGHMGMIEEPKQSVSILNNFLLKTI
jgi:pimeloyl-ACP methyl ester carboxylesterase